MNCDLTAFLSCCDRRGIALTESYLYVSIAWQCLTLFRSGTRVVDYPISTSERPPCNRENSFGTPLGLHGIAEKIGDGVPLGGVFQSRIYTGKHYTVYSLQEPNQLLITTRILRLCGLEPVQNAGPGCDSYQRYIYIHGTNREQAIGTPQSHGCILLRNRDMLELYAAVTEQTLVWIADNYRDELQST